MHNARIRSLAVLWWLVAMPLLAQPLPPLTRSVLTTNIPAFGNPGEFLTRQAPLPYLLWVPYPGDTVLSNYVVALSNLIWQSDNIVSNYVNSVSNLANGGSGAYILSLNGQGTNTTLNSSASGKVPLVVSNTIGNPTNSFEVPGTNGITGKSVVVTSDGKEGIGTNLPQAVLHVRGTNINDTLFMVDNSANIAGQTNALQVKTNGNTVLAGSITTPTTASCSIGGVVLGSGYISHGIAAGFGSSGSSALYPYFVASGAGYVLRGAGNVGSPSNNLFIAGQFIASNGVVAKTHSTYATNVPPLSVEPNVGMASNIMQVLGTNATPVFVVSSNNTASHYPQIGIDTNAFEVVGTNGITGKSVVVTADGKMGIGTNLPTAPLVVRGTNTCDTIFMVDNSAMIAGQTNALQVKTNGAVHTGVKFVSTIFDSATANVTLEAGANPDVSFSITGGTNTASNTKRHRWRIFNGTAFAEQMTLTTNGAGNAVLGVGTNIPQGALHVTADNTLDNIAILGTTNRHHLARLDTNGNGFVGGAFTPTNGLIHQGAASSIANITIVTNSTQIWCLNGTNQLVTLPDVTKTPAYQIYRFSITNGNALVIFTNATGNQTIRDGTSYSFKQVGIGSPSFFHDGAAWWSAARTKVIFPNASWSTSTNIPMAVAGSNYITYDTLETSNGQGITLTNGYQIYIRDPGQYLLTYSLVTQVGHNNDTNRVWLQQSAQNTPRSRTDVKLTSTSEQVVMTVNYIVPVVTNLTWFALACRSTDTGAQFVTGAAADATQPAMPSAIVTVNKISDTSP